MTDIISYFTFRTVILMFSTTFSILFVMVMLNIIPIDELVKILKLSPDAANALKLIFKNLKEVTGNIGDILSQLLNKLFGWAGIEVDLSKIKIDPGHAPQPGPDGAQQ